MAEVHDLDLYTLPTPMGVAKLVCAKQSAGMIYVSANDTLVLRVSSVQGQLKKEVAAIRDFYFNNGSLVMDIGEKEPLRFHIRGVAGEYDETTSYHVDLDWKSELPLTEAGNLIQDGFYNCSFSVLK
jgi:hypothetical protein